MHTIRSADDNDIPALAHIHVEGWKAGYKNIVDQDFLNTLNVDDRAKDWKSWMDAGEVPTIIAEIDGKPVGFSIYGGLRTPPPGTSSIRPLYTGELYALYVLPDHWGQGIGTALMKSAVNIMRENKHKSMCLWVVDKNERAKNLYEKLGGQRIGKKQVEIGPSKVKEICYGWRDTSIIL